MNTHPLQTGVAIIGCGYWGINYVRVFSELPNAKVIVVCDQRLERLQEVKRRFPEIAVTTELDNALESVGVTAVVICTGATTHYDVAYHCLAGGKHVLVEKPMTTTAVEAQTLIALADKRGLTLMVGHTFLYNPAIQKLKEYMNHAEMGQIYYLYSRRTNLGPIRYDVNAIWDLAPHDVSIFNYLLDGTPLWVSAVGVNVLKTPRQDVGFVSLGYPNHIVGNIHVSWAEPNKVRELVVVGGNQRIVFDDLNVMEQVKIYEKGITPQVPEAATYGEYRLTIRDGNIFSPHIQVSEPLKNQCSHFLECLTQGKRPLTDGWAGLAVIQVLTAIDDSIAQNGVPVLIKHKEELSFSYAQRELSGM